VAIPLVECVLPLHDQVDHIAFAPDSQSLALAKTAGRIAIYDFCTASLINVLDAFDASGAITFSPDGKLLAGASVKRIYIYRVATGELLPKFPFYNAYVVAISPDSWLLAAG
jgi:WD40 repeat protein